MNEATIAQTIMTLLILVIFMGFLIWGIKSRQFHNVEDAKYKMLEDDTETGKNDNKRQEERS
jgi:cbb3-type cytochrome oxidase maturation protein